MILTLTFTFRLYKRKRFLCHLRNSVDLLRLDFIRRRTSSIVRCALKILHKTTKPIFTFLVSSIFFYFFDNFNFIVKTNGTFSFSNIESNMRSI